MPQVILLLVLNSCSSLHHGELPETAVLASLLVFLPVHQPSSHPFSISGAHIAFLLNSPPQWAHTATHAVFKVFSHLPSASYPWSVWRCPFYDGFL